MPMPGEMVTIPSSDLRGSRWRCLLLTHQPRDVVAQLLTEIAQPFATVSAGDLWLPRGLWAREEARLDQTPGLLSPEQRRVLSDWWLEVLRRANTPNWDIASTCLIGGRHGVILVEAKAHSAELSDAGKAPGNAGNDRSIRAAVHEANEGLNAVAAGWNLTVDSHYQLSNRFACAWKLAALGVPAVLVYLGFLNAEEMADRGTPFRSHDEWVRYVRSHARGIVPEGIWHQALMINGTPMRPLLRSMDYRWVCWP